MATTLKNYINGDWRTVKGVELINVVNPVTAEVLGKVPLSPASEIDLAAIAAEKAQKDWRRTPVTDRIQYLFKLKFLLEDHLEDLARTITMECGKTLNESRGELRRAIENVENACSAPNFMQGDHSEDISKGIDELMIRQPVGVCAAISPFNFPGMIPFWFLPYAIACGNTFILKPSEKVPLTMQKAFELLEQSGLPKGVVNLVHGGKDAVDAILDHRHIRAISFVGSTPIAKYIYRRAAENGKRAQCQGGAKNPLIVLPDADPDTTIRIAADSAFGCAGQRCLAASLAITVGDAHPVFAEAISEIAATRLVGNGLDEEVEMGAVITPESKVNIENISVRL